MRGLPFLLFVVAGLAGGVAVAEGTGASAADTAAGKTLYDEKCLVCHGPAGLSQVPTQPILAGQSAEYTAAQMRAFRDGTRQNAIMAPLAADLTDADIINMAQYLAEQPAAIAGTTDPAAAAKAEKLYRGGSIARALPACTACHGPTGAGIPPLYPRLSGQYAEYTAATLREYKTGTRAAPIMSVIAAELSEEEINNLAQYISGLSH